MRVPFVATKGTKNARAGNAPAARVPSILDPRGGFRTRCVRCALFAQTCGIPPSARPCESRRLPGRSDPAPSPPPSPRPAIRGHRRKQAVESGAGRLLTFPAVSAAEKRRGERREAKRCLSVASSFGPARTEHRREPAQRAAMFAQRFWVLLTPQKYLAISLRSRRAKHR